MSSPPLKNSTTQNINSSKVPKITSDTDSDALNEKLNSKIISMFILIVAFVSYKICKNEVRISDFFNYKSAAFFPSFSRLYELRNYLLFFLLMLPLSYFLWKSNLEWIQVEIEKYDNDCERKRKEKEEKRQEEFERKMREIYFKKGL